MSSHTHDHELAENTSLRNDPTKTLEIRRNLEQDLRTRFKNVRGVVRQTVGYENDAFDLSQNENPHEPTESYDFPNRGTKINAFIEDLNEWVEDGILEPVSITTIAALRQARTQEELEQAVGDFNHWIKEYITNSYLKALNTSTGRLMQAGFSVSHMDDNEVFQQRTTLKTLADLYTRTYTNLENITNDMGDVIREEVTKGFAEGDSPKEMANRITKELRTIQRTRAETLARTETMNAATQATLDRFEQAGVDGVVHGEWLTAMDADVCPACRRLGGETFTIEEMRNNLGFLFRGQTFRLAPPAHPNGRCSLVPKPGIDTDDLDPLDERVPGTLLG